MRILESDLAANNIGNSPSKLLISLLLPTRGRPELAKRFFQSLVDTTTYLDAVEVILYADEDDYSSHELDSDEVRIKKTIGPRMNMGEYNSYCFEKSRGEIIILVNDDMIVRTQDWDERVRAMHAEFPDEIYLAYGNDLFKGGKLCTFPILSRTTCNILVEPYPKAYTGAFIDYHLFDIFKRLQKKGYNRVCYLDDVVFEHLHYRTGKAEVDETYTSRGRFDDDSIFIGLIEARSKASQRLLMALRGEPLPKFDSLLCEKYNPSNLISVVLFFSKRFLFDFNLPFRWKSWLWMWFLGRYMAAQGLLRPFVK